MSPMLDDDLAPTRFETAEDPNDPPRIAGPDAKDRRIADLEVANETLTRRVRDLTARAELAESGNAAAAVAEARAEKLRQAADVIETMSAQLPPSPGGEIEKEVARALAYLRDTPDHDPLFLPWPRAW